MQIVHVDLNTKYLLTAERMLPGANGANPTPAADLCDADGNALSTERRHECPAIYLDTISGKYFMMISPERKAQLEEKGDEEIFQGAGAGAGWFVEAPDFTLHGRHGERAPKTRTPAAEPPAQSWKAPIDHARKPRKTVAKKAAKKTAAKAAA